MIRLSIEELINYEIKTTTDLTEVLKRISISSKAHISQRVQQELRIAFRNNKEYKTVIKQRGIIHGFSLVTNENNQQVLTYYQFHKGA